RLERGPHPFTEDDAHAHRATLLRFMSTVPRFTAPIVEPTRRGEYHVLRTQPVKVYEDRSLASAPSGKPGSDLAQVEPIPIDSRNPKHAAYLTLVRDKIKSNWGYPCVTSPSTGKCEYNTAHLVVVFGILKGGRVEFVRVRESSGLSPYDDAAV